VDPIRKLVSERLRTQAPATHPDTDVLAAFAENALGRGERDEVVAHLADCQECREVLYVSLPHADHPQTVLSFNPNRARWLRLRWATFVGLAGIVTALFTVRYEFLTTRNHPSSATLGQPVSTYAKVVEEKPTAENDRTGPPVEARKAAPAPPRLDKERPELKTMHAKPAAGLDFDQSGQVHLRPQAAPPAQAESSFHATDIASNNVALASDDTKKAQVGGVGGVAPSDALEAAQAPAAIGRPFPIRAASAALQGEAKSVAVKDGTVTTNLRREKAAAYTGMASPFDWTLSPEGVVLRSSDRGKTWQPLGSFKAGPFTALSSVGAHVWVGGKNGALYHSDDSGQSWHEITPSAGDRLLKTSVTHIEFPDPLNGTVSTVDGERWTTADGGLTWRHD
jgi:hypothetical protein